MSRRGIKTIRYRNDEVINDLAKVRQEIDLLLQS